MSVPQKVADLVATARRVLATRPVECPRCGCIRMVALEHTVLIGDLADALETGWRVWAIRARQLDYLATRDEAGALLLAYQTLMAVPESEEDAMTIVVSRRVHALWAEAAQA